MVEYTDPETIMAQLTNKICKWIDNSQHHVWAQKKATKLQAQIRNNDICTYYKHKPPKTAKTTNDKNLLHPPWTPTNNKQQVSLSYFEQWG